MKTKYSIEQEVLFSLLRNEKPALAAGLNYDQLLRLLHRHKLLSLAEGLLPVLPQSHAASYRSELRQWAARSLVYHKELKQINSLFKSQGINGVCLKGPLLSQQLYANYHSRYYSDLDILLKPVKIKQAVELLSKLEYFPEENLNILNENILEDLGRFNNDLILRNPKTGVSIELHFGLYVEQLLEKGREDELVSLMSYINDKEEYTLLENEVNFLYLCFHGAKHMYFRLCWLRDISQFIRVIDFDAQKVLDISDRMGFNRMLRISLHLIREYFDSKLPEEFEKFIATKKHRLMLHWNKEIIAGPGELVYENFRQKRRVPDPVPGINLATRKHFFIQVLYLIGLRSGLKTKVRFLIYQFKKRK